LYPAARIVVAIGGGIEAAADNLASITRPREEGGGATV